MDLKAVMDDYLKNELINYAILIKGEWGSGKTFFVKKNIVKRYDNALYISLYGISSIDKLSEKIYLEIIIYGLPEKAAVQPLSYSKDVYHSIRPHHKLLPMQYVAHSMLF